MPAISKEQLEELRKNAPKPSLFGIILLWLIKAEFVAFALMLIFAVGFDVYQNLKEKPKPNDAETVSLRVDGDAMRSNLIEKK